MIYSSQHSLLKENTIPVMSWPHNYHQCEYMQVMCSTCLQNYMRNYLKTHIDNSFDPI